MIWDCNPKQKAASVIHQPHRTPLKRKLGTRYNPGFGTAKATSFTRLSPVLHSIRATTKKAVRTFHGPSQTPPDSIAKCISVFFSILFPSLTLWETDSARLPRAVIYVCRCPTGTLLVTQLPDITTPTPRPDRRTIAPEIAVGCVASSGH